MFKLDMKAIRQSAGDAWLMAIPANAAILANESGKNCAKNSQQLPKIAGIAKIAISQQRNCILRADPAHDLPSAEPTAPTIPGKPPKQTFIEHADTWLHLDRAYQAHHFKCPTCKAAGLGYGLRCGVGAALWGSYQDSNLIQQKRNTR